MELPERPPLPIPMLLLVTAAVIVLGLLVAQFAVGIVLWVLRLLLIAAAFAVIAFVGYYLWRRGDVRQSDA